MAALLWEPCLEAGSLEGVATAYVTAVEAGLEPAHALLGRTVGERVRHHLATGLLLQAVITNGVGRVQRFLDIPGLQPFVSALAVLSPDACQAVGLQLLAHQ